MTGTPGRKKKGETPISHARTWPDDSRTRNDSQQPAVGSLAILLRRSHTNQNIDSLRHGDLACPPPLPPHQLDAGLARLGGIRPRGSRLASGRKHMFPSATSSPTPRARLFIYHWSCIIRCRYHTDDARSVNQSSGLNLLIDCEVTTCLPWAPALDSICPCFAERRAILELPQYP
ncbi:hypothetical protein LZ30DRAFT_458715 [Colletotrichum cereale]|nr:hypothetical protein LZ30DRAFT_458715 [Colletotrichum cereale]